MFLKPKSNLRNLQLNSQQNRLGVCGSLSYPGCHFITLAFWKRVIFPFLDQIMSVFTAAFPITLLYSFLYLFILYIHTSLSFYPVHSRFSIFFILYINTSLYHVHSRLSIFLSCTVLHNKDFVIKSVRQGLYNHKEVK